MYIDISEICLQDCNSKMYVFETFYLWFRIYKVFVKLYSTLDRQQSFKNVIVVDKFKAWTHQILNEERTETRISFFNPEDRSSLSNRTVQLVFEWVKETR